LLGGSLISGAANFVSGIYIARVLGVNAFGLFRFAQAFMNYLVLLIDSGLSTLGTIEIARDKERVWPITANLLILRLLLALAVFTLTAMIVLLLPLAWELRALFICTFLYVFYRALSLDWAFQGLEQMPIIAIGKVIYAGLFLLSMIFLVRSSADLIRVPFFQSLAGLSTALVFLLVFLKRSPAMPVKDVSKDKMVDYLWRSVPLGLSAILIQIYNNLDSIMLGIISGAVVVGYYNAAYNVYYICLAFFVLWQSTVLPVAGAKSKEGREIAERFLNKYFRLTMLAVMAGVVTVFLAAPLIIKILYGSAYQDAGPALRWLIWTMVPCAIGHSYGSLLLIPFGNTRGFLMAVAGGALINIVLNILLIPSFGCAGAAQATIAAEAVVALIGALLARRIVRLALPAILARPVIFALIALLPVQLIASPVLVKTCVFLTIYMALVILCERMFIMDFVREVVKRA
jgi:O-antigen/teichoic acid export membrane protein